MVQHQGRGVGKGEILFGKFQESRIETINSNYKPKNFSINETFNDSDIKHKSGIYSSTLKN